jgi:hypothetical protein
MSRQILCRWKARERRRPLLSTRPRRLLLEQLEERRVLAAVAWDGGGGDLLWNNPLNWSTNELPGPDDDVRIDAPGNVTIVYDSAEAVTVRSLALSDSLRLSAGSIDVSGAFSVDPGQTLSVVGAGVEFVAQGVSTIDGTNLIVSDGARLSLPSATSYTHTHRSNSVHLRASGNGSLLDLGSVELLVGANGAAERLLIEALEGGTVDLSGVTQILDPEEGDLRGRAVRISADGADSRVDLSNLEVLHDRSSAFWSSVTGYSSLTATNGGEITAPSLTTLNAVEINLDGTGILPVGQITTLTNSRLTVTASDYTFNSLATIDGTNFLVSGGGSLSLPAATSYTHTHRSNSVHLRASGTGSLLDLGAVELVIGANGTAERLLIEALEGGTVDLSGVTQILDPEEGDLRGRAVRISADGADSRVDLASLEVMHDRSSAFWSNITGYSSLTATNGERSRPHP